jgi:hypothetical protein
MTRAVGTISLPPPFTLFSGSMMARPKLPLPTGLIGTAGSVALDYGAGRPFFPFLSLAQIGIIAAMGAIIFCLFALVLPRAVLPFTATGMFIGMLPSIWASAPARLTVRTPRAEPWADFTRQWACASRYQSAEGDENLWLPNMPFWIRWPGDSIRLKLGQDGLEVTGRLQLMRQLKRNFDRISACGHRWS